MHSEILGEDTFKQRCQPANSCVVLSTHTSICMWIDTKYSLNWNESNTFNPVCSTFLVVALCINLRKERLQKVSSHSLLLFAFHRNANQFLKTNKPKTHTNEKNNKNKNQMYLKLAWIHSQTDLLTKMILSPFHGSICWLTLIRSIVRNYSCVD